MENNFIFNWSNALRNDDIYREASAKEYAEKYKTAGYTSDETIDMLLSNGFDVDTAERVSSTLFENKPLVKESQNTFRHLPYSYQDIMSYINNSLSNNTPELFIEKVSCSVPIKINTATKKSLIKLAELAQENQIMLTELHNTLSPYFEEELYINVLESKKLHNERTASNDLSFTCNCDKFKNKNYEEFGLACEHIISKHRNS